MENNIALVYENNHISIFDFHNTRIISNKILQVFFTEEFIEQNIPTITITISTNNLRNRYIIHNFKDFSIVIFQYLKARRASHYYCAEYVTILGNQQYRKESKCFKEYEHSNYIYYNEEEQQRIINEKNILYNNYKDVLEYCIGYYNYLFQQTNFSFPNIKIKKDKISTINHNSYYNFNYSDFKRKIKHSNEIINLIEINKLVQILMNDYWKLNNVLTFSILKCFHTFIDGKYTSIVNFIIYNIYKLNNPSIRDVRKFLLMEVSNNNRELLHTSKTESIVPSTSLETIKNLFPLEFNILNDCYSILIVYKYELKYEIVECLLESINDNSIINNNILFNNLTKITNNIKKQLDFVINSKVINFIKEYDILNDVCLHCIINFEFQKLCKCNDCEYKLLGDKSRIVIVIPDILVNYFNGKTSLSYSEIVEIFLEKIYENIRNNYDEIYFKCKY